GAAAGVHAPPGQHDPDPTVGHGVGDLDDPGVQELNLVHGDHLGAGPPAPHDLLRTVHRLGFHGQAVVGRDVVEAGVAGVEVGLGDLDLLAGDDRPADPPDPALALAGEHHAGYDLDPARASDVEHRSRRCQVSC